MKVSDMVIFDESGRRYGIGYADFWGFGNENIIVDLVEHGLWVSGCEAEFDLYDGSLNVDEMELLVVKFNIGKYGFLAVLPGDNINETEGIIGVVGDCAGCFIDYLEKRKMVGDIPLSLYRALKDYNRCNK